MSPRRRLAALAATLPHADADELPALVLELVELAVPVGGGAPRLFDPRSLNNGELVGGEMVAGTSPVPGPDVLVERLLARRRMRLARGALEAIVTVWPRLPAELRRVVYAVGADRWAELGRAMLRGPGPGSGGHVGLARMLEDAADPSMSGLLPGLLASKDKAVAQSGERALLRTTVRALGAVDPDLLGGELAPLVRRRTLPLPMSSELLELHQRELVTHVAASAWSFPAHRRSGALLAALLILGAPGHDLPAHGGHREIRRLLSERSHPSHGPLRAVLKRSRVAVVRERALRCLAIPALADAAAERFAVAESVEEHAAALPMAHLLLRPQRRRALARVRLRPRRHGGSVALPKHAPIPSARQLAGMAEPARRGAVRVVAAMRVDEELRRAALAPMLADPEAGVRLASSSGIGVLDVADYCFDRSAAVARHAAHRWSTVGTGVAWRWPVSGADERRGRLGERLRRSPDAMVRRIAADEIARLDPWRAGEPASRLAARRWQQADERSFTDALAGRLRASAGDVCVEAILASRRLGLARRFERELIRLASSDDARIAATAVGALASVPSDPALEALASARTSADPRVRANAVDAALRSVRVGVRAPSIVELKSDPDHRVRGAVARALVVGSDASGSPRDGIDLLEAMLSDDRPAHRRAGAWAAERALVAAPDAIGDRWRALAERIAQLAGSDKNEAVRARATHCARRVLVDLRRREAVGPEPVRV